VEEGARWTWHMRRGEMTEAWAISDAVVAREETWANLPPERHLRPVWRGESVEGKRVIVRCHHGLGDTIQFVRYIPRLAGIAESVVIAAQSPLIPILHSVWRADRIIDLDGGEDEGDWEVEIEITELPHLFRDTLDSLPSLVPYLLAEPAADAGRPEELLVGIVHEAGDWDPRRSVPRELLGILADVPGVTLIDLQPQSRKIFIPEGFGLPEGEGDVMQIGRLFQGLDLVISVDTMAAHLAGALALPVWTLLHSDPDWRWLEGRRDSPWYPTMQLFRQEKAGEWEPLLRQLRVALERHAVILAG
jgi:hypothetical protein